MKYILEKLIQHQRLSEKEAEETLSLLAQGAYTPSEMTAFISCFLMRPIALEELEGFKNALLKLCVKVNLEGLNTVDLCGTGGDGKDTFNISTLASFIVAGAGQCVTKHGNNGVSSICGSSNVLDYLGYSFAQKPDEVIRDLEKAGIAFLHAPLFHPALKSVAPIRKELGIKTFFNMLGPLVNPAQPNHQLVGVFNLELARLYEYLFQKIHTNYCIVHSLDGYDEISLTGEFSCIDREGPRILTPKDLKLQTVQAQSLIGGKTIKESATLFLDILCGKASPQQRSVVLANAAMALKLAKNIDFDEAFLMAEESLDSGMAYRSLQQLIKAPKFQYLT